MKPFFILLFASISIVSCSQKKQDIQNISVTEFKELVSDNAIVLDVRTEEETSQGQIEGASSLDYYGSNFEKSLSLIQKNKEVFVYCQSGGRSKKAAKLLAQMGQLKVYNVKGGIRAWKENGFEVTVAQESKEVINLEVSLDSLNNIISQNQTAFISFQTKWCAPCRQMDPVITKLKEANPEVAFLKIDMDKNDALAKIYKVESIPTFFVYKNQNESWNGTGIQEKEFLQKLLE
jgi:rhodanese-related sulfurtransferase